MCIAMMYTPPCWETVLSVLWFGGSRGLCGVSELWYIYIGCRRNQRQRGVLCMSLKDKILYWKWRCWGDGGWVARHGWRLGGCRRLGARRGQRLVPLHGNPPPIGWRYGGGWHPWEFPSLWCDPLTLSHFLPGPGADYRDHEKTGGRGWLPVSCIAK